MNIEQLKQQFHDNGFLVLSGYYSAAQTDHLQSAIDDQIRADDGLMVVDDTTTNERTFLGLCEDHWAKRYKYNDLYLDNPVVRETVLEPELVALLCALLDRPPVLCNSLYFMRGSSQGNHVDSLYMTPRTEGSLAATWLALEDVTAETGPLVYYPKSHRFRPFRFSDGSQHARPEEMGQWHAHIQAEIKRTDTRPVTFLARRGDLFIWHADLLHGGGPIVDKARTRRSLVCHYYTSDDCRQIGWADAIEPLSGGFWLQRSPPPVPLQGTDWINTIPFPESRYLERNPDVRAAVESGQVSSGLRHYLTFGHRENRLA